MILLRVIKKGKQSGRHLTRLANKLQNVRALVNPSATRNEFIWKHDWYVLPAYRKVSTSSTFRDPHPSQDGNLIFQSRLKNVSFMQTLRDVWGKSDGREKLPKKWIFKVLRAKTFLLSEIPFWALPEWNWMEKPLNVDRPKISLWTFLFVFFFSKIFITNVSMFTSLL